MDLSRRVAARDALRARTVAVGVASSVVAMTLTGAIAGAMARAHDAGAEAVAQEAPALVPAPRRTVYLQVRAVTGPQATRRASPPRPPANPPRPARQAPVTSSAGS